MSIEQLRERMPVLRQRQQALNAESAERSQTRPRIVLHSCAWQKPSRHFLPAYASLQRRLASSSVRRSCAYWLKMFWSAKIRLPFVIAFRFPRAHLKTKDWALQTAEITFCVRGVSGPPCGVPSTLGLTSPFSITPAFKNARMSFSSRLSSIRFAMLPISLS